MIFVDASAIVAVICKEPRAGQIVAALVGGGTFVTSPIAVYEAVLAVSRVTRSTLAQASEDVQSLLEASRIEIDVVTAQHAEGAINAHKRFGKGRHRAQLNMGDCFAYAMARAQNAAILFVGDDFVHTDLKNALETT